MRPITLHLILAIGLAATPLASGATQDTAAAAKKPSSKTKAVVKKLVDTAATAAAGAGLQSLLGKNAGGVANALGVGATAAPCSPSAGVSSGAAIVGVAKGIVKQTADSAPPPAAAPCPQGGQMPQMPGMPTEGIPGMPGGVPAGAPASPMAGMGAMAAMTPIGMAVAAAPLAGSAAKGIKGMLGGKPQDKIAMLRELGKGSLILRGVKFIEGTAEMEPGFEPSFAALGEAIGLAEGTYVLYVAAEADKGVEPDTILARKRLQKVWAAVLVNGVPDQRIIAVAVLPKEMSEGRKPPKPGQARVEIIRLVNQP